MVTPPESHVDKVSPIAELAKLASSIAVEDDDFFKSRVIRDLNEFKAMSDIIVANRLSDDITDVKDKVVTSDLFGRDS